MPKPAKYKKQFSMIQNFIEIYSSWEEFAREVDFDDLPVFVIIDSCLYAQKQIKIS
jgi:hypothetical protein